VEQDVAGFNRPRKPLGSRGAQEVFGDSGRIYDDRPQDA
jgi:hypothetical protein